MTVFCTICFDFHCSYTFYDGPPFATGLPHYGHILTGTIKDVVTRYAHQEGWFAIQIALLAIFLSEYAQRFFTLFYF